MLRRTIAVLLLMLVPMPASAGALDDARAALTAQSEGRLDAAIRLYTRAIESGDLSDDNLTYAYNNRGLAFDDQGFRDRAIADFDAALANDPDGGEWRVRRPSCRCCRRRR